MPVSMTQSHHSAQCLSESREGLLVLTWHCSMTMLCPGGDGTSPCPSLKGRVLSSWILLSNTLKLKANSSLHPYVQD